ncbi:flavodoxin [Acutalibacter muris]|uniref:flavodoxin n=1 Tax=Acutalibacter muris TaxID=1796620 RepID=UPI00272E5A91|nr:flavodoxin [Acutalibacter muris]
MKKIIAILLCLTCIVSLVACNSGTANSSSTAAPAPTATPEPTTEPTPAPTEASTPTAEPTAEPTQEPTPEPASEGGKTLVVYYSASGNTGRVAQAIANTTGGDTFELIPVTPYTDEDLDWTADGSRVNQEHDDESLRDIALESTTVDNWAEYDTVYVGYPIWWGIAAWPVNSFIKSNDFTGKTVIPFCTSSSSGLGESGRLLADMAGTGDWQEGQRFQSSASEDEVAEWVNSLG